MAGREGFRSVVTLLVTVSKTGKCLRARARSFSNTGSTLDRVRGQAFCDRALVLLSHVWCGDRVYCFAALGLDGKLLISRSELPIARSRCLQIARQALELLGAISEQHRS